VSITLYIIINSKHIP